MPTNATITSFYTFSAGTKARATQVNNNFDVFRGHIIPVDPNTIASANITYDLGSDQNRWRTSYVQSIDFDRSTSTASATIEADANTNTGEMVHKVDGSQRLRVRASGIVGVRSLYNTTYDGSNPGIGGRVYSAGTTASYGNVTSASVLLPGTTLTISTVGNPVYLGMVAKSKSSGIGYFQSTIGPAYGLSTGTNSIRLDVCRNTTTSIVATYYYTGQFALGSAISGIDQYMSLPPFIGIDDSAPSGTNVYFAKIQGVVNSTLLIDNYRLVASEGCW